MAKIDAKTLGEALLAATFETTIAKTKTFQLSLADFPIEAAVAFMQYGIGRKFNDAVGGSDKTAETKVAMAEAMIADWKAGKIGRQAQPGVTDEVKVRRRIIRTLIKGTALWEKIKDAEDLEAKLDKIYERQAEAARKSIDASVAEEIEAAKAKAAQAKKLAESIDLGDL